MDVKKKGLDILNQIDGLSVMSILECCKKSTLEINDTLLTIVQWVVPALTVKLECSILG